MQILTVIRSNMKILGVNPDKGTKNKWKYGRYIFLTLMWHQIITMGIYAAVHIDDMRKFADATNILLSTLGYALKYSILIVYEKELQHLMMTLWTLVEKGSKLSENNNHFKSTEKLISQYSTIFRYLIIIILILYCLRPAFKIFYAHWTNTISHELYVAPFNNLYLFDATWSPIFEITYVAYVLGTITSTLLSFSTDLFFCATALYISAIYNAIKLYLQSIDSKINKNYNCNDIYRKHIIINSIQFHNELIGFISNGNTIFNKMIITQYSYQVVCLGCTIFLFNLNDFYTALYVIVSYFAIDASLFIFCWFGSLVHDEGRILHKSIYSLNWYNYSCTERKLIYFMMLRLETPAKFYYRMFDCNMSNFMQINKAAFTALTALQSMEH